MVTDTPPRPARGGVGTKAGDCLSSSGLIGRRGNPAAKSPCRCPYVRRCAQDPRCVTVVRLECKSPTSDVYCPVIQSFLDTLGTQCKVVNLELSTSHQHPSVDP